MTEQEWLACTDSQKMLEFAGGKLSERKLRLFAVACCRRIWHLFRDQRSRKAVEMAEQFADGLLDRKRLVQARDEASEAKRQFVTPTQVVDWRAACAAQDATRDTGRSAGSNCSSEASRAVNLGDTNYCDPAEQQQQTHILRCIYGSLFRRSALDPACLTWHDGLVVSMAQRMYDSRDFSDMPVLADALEEAGCANQEMLSHCRMKGDHVRGCWVIDLLLKKE